MGELNLSETISVMAGCICAVGVSYQIYTSRRKEISDYNKIIQNSKPKVNVTVRLLSKSEYNYSYELCIENASSKPATLLGCNIQMRIKQWHFFDMPNIDLVNFPYSIPGGAKWVNKFSQDVGLYYKDRGAPKPTPLWMTVRSKFSLIDEMRSENITSFKWNGSELVPSPEHMPPDSL